MHSLLGDYWISILINVKYFCFRCQFQQLSKFEHLQSYFSFYLHRILQTFKNKISFLLDWPMHCCNNWQDSLNVLSDLNVLNTPQHQDDISLPINSQDHWQHVKLRIFYLHNVSPVYLSNFV